MMKPVLVVAAAVLAVGEVSAFLPAPGAVAGRAWGLGRTSRAAQSRVMGLRMADNEQLKQTQQAVDSQKAELQALMGEGELKVAPAKESMSEKGFKKPGKPKVDVLEQVEVKPFADPSKSPPPRSFQMCVEQAYLSCKAAIEDGHKLMEVEFPPLPQAVMDGDTVGADTVLDAQLTHSRGVAKLFKDKKVAIVFADIIERNRFVDDVSFSNKDKEGNIRYTALGGGYKGAFFERLWVKQEYIEDVRDEDEIFIIIGASAQELPDVRKFCESAGDRPVILFNLKLQILRGDFGLPAFPPKSLHYEWLCNAVSAYLVLPRTYTRSVTKPPFLINYSGAIFRTYPGKHQVLLEVPDEKNGGGRYERTMTLDKRPALSEVREYLAQELQLDAIDDNEAGDKKLLGVDLNVLRSGVVTKTWWEQDDAVTKSVSDKWRD